MGVEFQFGLIRSLLEACLVRLVLLLQLSPWRVSVAHEEDMITCIEALHSLRLFISCDAGRSAFFSSHKFECN